MKGFLIATALGLGLLGAAVPTAGTAWASGSNDRHAHGDYLASKHFRALIHEPRQHYYRERQRHGHQPSYWRGQKRGHKFVNRGYEYRRGPAYRQAVRPCRQTSKIGFDGHGRRARIGGVMCYDTYVTPYIVRGSHFIIHYF